MLHGAGMLSCMWGETFGLTCSAVVSACSVWSHANQPDRCRQSLFYAGHVLYRDMTCHPVCQSVCEPSASQADSPRGLLWVPRRCEGLTEHAMASNAAASSRGNAHNTADWLSCTWKKALQKRRDGVVDLLRSTKLQPMADKLGFWAYRLGVPSRRTCATSWSPY